MNISYTWLQSYFKGEVTPEQAAVLLTDTGLEVEGLKPFCSVTGGLEGLVIGEVLTKTKHPDADRLNITTVNIGNQDPLTIVCGAPNVDKGQKVVVALVGTTIFPTQADSFTIKKAKIRGQESMGMICAEDEIGLGIAHDGIMVLDKNAVVGNKASSYFSIENDTIFEIGLTANRSDAMSHLGVARDLVAALQIKGEEAVWHYPEFSYKPGSSKTPITIKVMDEDACPRYAGTGILNITIAPSPSWLQNRLLSIGLTPVNNVVDCTNFVLHEMGQPLHAFDLDKIKEGKIIVKKVAEGTPFVTLDGVERKLSCEDLMICNSVEPMCIGGVFGGLDYGISEKTINVFLESAYFDPVHIRKSSKHHGLNTDASFRFERGVDPNLTILALQRAASLIVEVAGGKLCSDIYNSRKDEFPHFAVKLKYSNCDRLIGVKINRNMIKSILASLDIKVLKDDNTTLQLAVPPYRTDVQREADVIEEIIRIYGYKNIPFSGNMNIAVSLPKYPSTEQVINTISQQLSDTGFNEIMTNSLTSGSYLDVMDANTKDKSIPILNPLSNELNVMRTTMLFSGLEVVSENSKHRNENLKLYELGKIYSKMGNEFHESKRLAIYISGNISLQSWRKQAQTSSFFDLVAVIDKLCKQLEIVPDKNTFNKEGTEGLEYKVSDKTIALCYPVPEKILMATDIQQSVFYGEIMMDEMLLLISKKSISYAPIAKFPAVRRDLSLLLDNQVSFEDLRKAAFSADRKILKKVNLFDVYEGKKLEEGKKSYALSFILQDDNATLTDQRIDKSMQKILRVFQDKFNAKLR